ncbi:MAG: hypothetical protein FWD81_02385 [Methanomassiliicoccaceae archaeon]|nr:hypothetical protein [Methanomassiliicoccaceae archaeon]
MFTALINNDDITISDVLVDKYGRTYILNSHVNQTVNDIEYITRYVHFISESGVAYVYTDEGYMQYDSEGNIVKIEDTCVDVIHYRSSNLNYFYSSIYFREGFVMQIDIAKDIVYVWAWALEGSLGYFYRSFGNSSPHVIGGEIIIRAEEGLVHLRIQEITYDLFTTEEVPKTELNLTNIDKTYIENDTLIAERYHIGITEKYRISYDGTKMIVEEYAPLVHSMKVITIQPLN